MQTAWSCGCRHHDPSKCRGNIYRTIHSNTAEGSCLQFHRCENHYSHIICAPVPGFTQDFLWLTFSHVLIIPPAWTNKAVVKGSRFFTATSASPHLNIPSVLHNQFHSCAITYTRVGTLIMATIYLQLIQNRYMLRSFTVLQRSHQHCVQPVASDVEVVGYL